MVDTTKLLQNLKSYRDSLSQQQKRLDADFDHLMTHYSAFAKVYEGDSAREFKYGWDNTENNFKMYLNETASIIRMLDERIMSLEAADRADYSLDVSMSVNQNELDTNEKIVEGTKPVRKFDPQEDVKIDDLDADALYERNGYYFRTDESGRPSGVYAQLVLKRGKRNQREQREVGNLGIENDEGGHLIGARFNGPTDAFNLVPQNANLNRGYWKTMENHWASELKSGNEVRVEMKMKYENSDSKRPDIFFVTYTIIDKKSEDSTTYYQIFFNQSHKEELHDTAIK